MNECMHETDIVMGLKIPFVIITYNMGMREREEYHKKSFFFRSDG